MDARPGGPVVIGSCRGPVLEELHDYENAVRRAAADAVVARLRGVNFRLMARARRATKTTATLQDFIGAHLQAPDDASVLAVEPEMRVFLTAARSSVSPFLATRHLVDTYLAMARSVLGELAHAHPPDLPVAFERAVGRLEADLVANVRRALDEQSPSSTRSSMRTRRGAGSC